MSTAANAPAPDLALKLVLAAGFVPFSAGISGYFLGLIGTAAPSHAWRTALGSLGFSLAEIEHWNPRVAEYWKLANGVGAVNITAAAVYVWIVAWFGLRRRERWAWYALLFSLIWVGGNDAASAIRYTLATGVPFALAPVTFVGLMTAGLALSYRSVVAPAAA
jgi:hypothetical protein